MSAEEKQEYLRDHIINKGFDAELFISYLEEKKENGADINAWEFEELKTMVQEFELETQRGSITRRMTDSNTKLKVFGGEQEQTEETEEKDKEDDNDGEDEESDDTYDNYGKDVTHEQGDQNSSDEEGEIKEDAGEKQPLQATKTQEKKEKEKSSSSSSSEDDDDEEKEEDNKKGNDDNNDDNDDDDDDDDEKKESKYYSKRTVSKYIPTQLVDQPRIEVDVSNPEIVKGKGLKGSYTVYSVQTDPFGWIVKRRYSDFEWIYNCLVKRFPANYIPSLPPKSFKNKNKDSIKLRLYSFQRFLMVILSSSELIYSQELVQFLSLPDADFYKAKKEGDNLPRLIPKPKDASSLKGGLKDIKDLINVTGTVELKMDPAIRKMARELTRLLKNVRPLEEEAANICKEMTGLYENLHSCFEKLGVVTASIHKAYQKVASKFDFDDFTRVSDLYLGLNNTFVEWGKIHKSDSSNFFKNIRMMFAFSNQEEQGMEKLVKLRNGFSLQYKEKKLSLESRKETLWNGKDLAKWQVDQDHLNITMTQLANDKRLAKKHMLPKETKNIHNLKETWAYYNSQIVTQTRYFSELKMKRMNQQMSEYIKIFTGNMNKSLGNLMDIKTKFIMLGVI